MLSTFTFICNGGTTKGLYTYFLVHPNVFTYAVLCRHNIFFWFKSTFQIEPLEENLQLFTRLFFLNSNSKKKLNQN